MVQHELEVGEVGGEGSGGGHLGYMDLQVEAEAKVFHELCPQRCFVRADSDNVSRLVVAHDNGQGGWPYPKVRPRQDLVSKPACAELAGWAVGCVLSERRQVSSSIQSGARKHVTVGSSDGASVV